LEQIAKTASLNSYITKNRSFFNKKSGRQPSGASNKLCVTGRKWHLMKSDFSWWICWLRRISHRLTDFFIFAVIPPSNGKSGVLAWIMTAMAVCCSFNDTAQNALGCKSF
jgi:hypothetical protein